MNLLSRKKHIHPKSACTFRGTYHRLASLSLSSSDNSYFSAELDRTAHAGFWVLGHHLFHQGSQLLSLQKT